MNLSNTEKKAIDEFKNRIHSEIGDFVEEIILFGSKVRDDSNEDSDIDVLVITAYYNHAIMKKISEIATEICIKYDEIFLVPIIEPRESIIKNRKYNTPFIQNIEKQGIAL